MPSPICAPLRRFVGLLTVLALVISSIPALAVPPTEPKSAEPHPAGGTKPAEKIAQASAEGEQAMGAFRKPEGWQVALFASEPDLANPVAMFVDHLARVFVCESFRQDSGVTDNRGHDQTWLHADLAAQSVQDRIDYHRKLLGDKAKEYTEHDDRIRLLVDSNGDKVVDRATVFAEGFNKLEEGTGAGVLEYNGDVFYTCIPRLWRLRDKDNDGVAEERETLHDGFGVRVAFRGHDMHGLVIGPDGRLYFSIGDRGYNVMTPAGTLKNPESGAVFRCELDGSNLEIFATGLRNPQELAFDDWGNLFTGDNNSDSGDQARWVNVLEGGDTGWRMMYQYISDRGPFNREKIWHPYSAETPAYIVPPIDNVSDGPSGLTYYPGTGLSDDYRGCFLLVDFRGGASNSGIRLVKVKPKGAFWEIDRNEQLIWNMLATDAQFGPDGALWVCDWVNGWTGEGKGRIYRFFNPETRDQPIVKEVEKLLHDGFQELAPEKLGTLLSHADQRVRLGAQWELAHRGESAEFQRLAADKSGEPFGRLHAAWGLAQIARLKPEQRAAMVRTLAGLLGDSDAVVRRAAVSGLADSGSSDAALKQYAAQIVKLLADSEPRVRYAAAIACGKLQLDSAFDSVCKLLAENADSDPAIRHAGIMALRGMTDATRVAELATHPSRSVRLAAVVALRKRQDPRVARFLADEDIAVETEAARAINDVPELHGALPALAALTKQANIPDALMHRALNANFRLGTPENAQAVAAVAADSSRSEAMRREALEMLRSWGEPGDLDRVMNRYSPLPARDPAPARDAVKASLGGILDAPEELRSFALSVAADLGVKEASATLREIALDPKQSADARTSALESLLRLDRDQAGAVIKRLSDDPNAQVRSAAVRGLAKIDPVTALPLLQKATQSSEEVERQTAWDTLAGIDSPEATQVIKAGLADYLQGKLPPDVWMNVLEASEGRLDLNEMAALDAFEEQAAEKDPLAPYRDCLVGGDPKAGRQIFMTRAELSCLRCHKVGNRGGEVGPNLSEIGKTKDSRYLLEAIVNPDAKIAENFETAVILTDEDEVLTGIVKAEDDEKVSLMTAEGKLIDIPTDSITVRKKGKSSMPSDLIKHMSRRQLRDLVAFLSSLKGRSGK
ncbi:MAG: PVC-type heme-binding CxxCH protein [Aureliella sp.]